MIVYQATKARFLNDTVDHHIEDVIASRYLAATGHYAPEAEFRSWQASLGQMANVLRDDEMPDDMGVGIEFGIPQSSKRIDFLLAGRGADDRPNLIIVELKQWSESKLSDKDGIIVARRGGAIEREGAHPCYQAWSYAALLEGFNEAIQDEGITLRPCAYLHNYVDDGVISHPCYSGYMSKAPLFLRGDAERTRLREFIKQHVKFGDGANLIYQLENGRIRPSKMLVDNLAKMLKGNREFVLIDEQKVAFESAIYAARRADATNRKVVIIRGGPGTGKSVVAINLLVQLSKLGLVAKYVSKNAAPRAVYKAKLTGTIRQTEISNLFSGSGAFTQTDPCAFDALIVDEAHRLNEKSGLYGNLGENQIKELISSAKCTIFFTDDDQVVTFKDIGHSVELERWAENSGAHISWLELASQFRCNGSDNYLTWLDDLLGIRVAEDSDFKSIQFDFCVIDSPSELHARISKKNEASNKARVVAGYCWDWVSRRHPDQDDIVIPQYGYSRKWNLGSDGSLWAIAPKSVNEVGCIHTCQGLEVDYIGVIIGDDLVAREGRLLTQPEKRSNMDKSLSGYKKMLKVDPSQAIGRADRIIRNTYRTLLTRGLKGCYVFCTDPETQEYFRQSAKAFTS